MRAAGTASVWSQQQSCRMKGSLRDRFGEVFEFGDMETGAAGEVFREAVGVEIEAQV